MIKNIVLLDFCSEKNRGDAAMQVGLINLVNKYFPKSPINIITVFGSNQYPDLIQEFDHSELMDVSLHGGLKPTFYPLGDQQKSELLIELSNALAFSWNLLILFFAYLKLPASFIKLFLPQKFHQTLEIIRSADLIIWNGRNFRSRNNKILEFYRLFSLVYHPLLCIAFKKPMICVGASVWKFNNKMSEHLLRYAFEHCSFVSVRESNSYANAKAILSTSFIPNLHLLPDLSFAIFSKLHRPRQYKPAQKSPQKVGITLVDWKSDGPNIRENYKATMISFIKYLLDSGAEVTLIPQVTKKWEAFDDLLDEIMQNLDPVKKKQITLVPGEPHVSELIKVYKKIDFLIATRMHSAIFALSVGTPVLPITYDTGGKWAIIEDLGYKGLLIPYSQVSLKKIKTLYSRIWKNRTKLMGRVREGVNQNIDLVNKHISLVVSD